MPNWLEGTFRARGEKENIHNFLMNGITPVDCMGGEITSIEKVISEEGDTFYLTIDGKTYLANSYNFTLLKKEG